MKCKIIFERDPKTLKVTDKIKAVKAPNGKRSLLFDSIKNDVKDDNEALINYYKVYTNEFKESFGDWEQGDFSKKLGKHEFGMIEFYGEKYRSKYIDYKIAEKKELINQLRETSVMDTSSIDRGKIKTAIWQDFNPSASWPNLGPLSTEYDNLATYMLQQQPFMNDPKVRKEFDKKESDFIKSLEAEIKSTEDIFKKNKDFVLQIVDLAPISDSQRESIMGLLFDDSGLFREEGNENIKLAVEILHALHTDIVERVDPNGEPKYNEIKDIISPTEVEFDEDLNTKLEEQETDEDSDISLKSKLPDETGRIDKTVEEKYFNDNTTQFHTTILQRIVDDKHKLAPLAEKLLSLSSEDMTIELVDKPYIETNEYKSGLKGEKSNKSAATYQEFGEGINKRRVINIASRAPINTDDLVPVILHEMLHGYTISELNKNTKVAKQLSKIHKEALKYKDEFRDDYPLTNLNEFIVAVYTNPYFIQDLQKLPSLGPNKSLWEDLLKYFKAMFKFNANEKTLFDDAFYVSNKILENYSESVKERSTIIHKDPSNEFFEKIYNVEITEETFGPEIKEGVDNIFKENSGLAQIGTKEQYSQYLNGIFPNSKVKDIVYNGTNTKFDEKIIRISPESKNILKDLIDNYDLKTVRDFDEFNDRRIIAGANRISSVDYLFEELREALLNQDLDSNLSDHLKNITEKITPKFSKIFFGAAAGSNFGEGFYFETELEKAKEWGNNIYSAVINTTKLQDRFQNINRNEYHFVESAKRNGFDSLKIYSETGSVEDFEYIVFEPEQIHILGSDKDIKGFKDFVNKDKQDVAKSSKITSKDTKTNIERVQQFLPEISNLTRPQEFAEWGYTLNSDYALEIGTQLRDFVEGKVSDFEFANNLLAMLEDQQFTTEERKNYIRATNLKQLALTVLHRETILSNAQNIFENILFKNKPTTLELRLVKDNNQNLAFVVDTDKGSAGIGFNPNTMEAWENDKKTILIKPNLSVKDTLKGPTTIIKTKKLPAPPTKKTTKKTSISDSTIEDKFNLRNADGSRKKHPDYNTALNKARKLNKANRDRPFKFTTTKVMGEKGDPSRTYYAVKVIPRDGEDKYSLSGGHSGQPKTDSTTSKGVGIDVDALKNAKDSKGNKLFSELQTGVIEIFNNKTSELTGEMVEVDVEELRPELRETFKKKGLKTTMLYGANNEKGYIIGRVSHAQDIIKTKKQTEEKATEQEHSPASILGRDMGTAMHSLKEAILKYIAESDNSGFKFNNDIKLFKEQAMKAFKETDEYKSLLKRGKDIFLNKSYTSKGGITTKMYDSDRMVDKLVESMLSLYHQAYVTQNEINYEANQGKEVDDYVKYKPLFVLEKPIVDPGSSLDEAVAGTMDVFVIFSDASASIYDHKFTNLRLEKKEFKGRITKAKRDEIYKIREAQGLSTRRWKHNDFYYVLPDDAINFMKQESWNKQIGKYSQMVTSLYGIKKIRQARILPVATTYTREKTGKKRKNKKGEEFEITAINPETSKVEFILTGQDDEGIANWALDIEKTGDVGLDEFITKLIDIKKALHEERVEKKAWNDPRYIDRIKKLDESIQALLINKDVTKIADSITALTVQIENDLQNEDVTFEQIITHLRDVKTFESFIDLNSNVIKELEKKYQKEIEEEKDNEFTTFSIKMKNAGFKLRLSTGALQDKLTSMVSNVNAKGADDNTKGGYMSEKLFESHKTQLDMGVHSFGLGDKLTHLRDSNHPIISLFSQVLDKVDTNVIKERRELESKVVKATQELKKWGKSRGLSGVQIYKDILSENEKLIFKYINYKKEVFPDYSDPKNKSNNIKWFNDNFERVGTKDDIFKARLERFTEFFNSSSVDENGKVDKKLAEEKLNAWRNKNDIKYNKGNNDAWTNPYVQGLLTPKNPEEYYSEEYKNLLKSENKPLLDFYNMYTEQMNKLAVEADFKIGENFIAEIRKDMLDAVIEDGWIMGLNQQRKNIINNLSARDADDGFQQIETNDHLGSRKVPIFFTNSVGKGNKLLDLSKSLMIFSDFVHKYKGHKDNEYAILSMRELLANTTGVIHAGKGKIARDAANNIIKSQDNNAKTLAAFDKWIRFYIYGEKKQDKSENVNKAIDIAMKVESYRSIAFNILSASAGHVNAEVQLNSIAKKADYFSRESLSKSRKDQKRFKALLESFRKSKGDIEKGDTKLLFASMFFEMAQESLTYEKANAVSASSMRNTMKKDLAYFMQRWSDDVLDNTVLGAMMRDFAIDPLTGKAYPIHKLKELYKNKPKYKNIEWKSLWDSIILHEKDLPDNLTAAQKDKLDLSKGPVILNQHTGEIMGDGTFTDFRRKAKAVVNRTKGNMSNADVALYKTHIVGRMLMQYRGWIPATILDRAKVEQYNLTMEQFEVGRWVAANQMLITRTDSKWKQFLIQIVPFLNANFDEAAAAKGEMTPMELKYKDFIADNPHLEPKDPNNPGIDEVTYEEYYNTYVAELKVLAKELQSYFAILGVSMLLFLGGGDDEWGDNPLIRGLIALIERILLELGFFLPFTPTGAGEFTTLITRKPAAVTGLIDSSWKLAKNTYDEVWDFSYGLESDKKLVWEPTMGDLTRTNIKKDRQPVGFYASQWVPPVKFATQITGFWDDSDSRETWWEYFMVGDSFVK